MAQKCLLGGVWRTYNEYDHLITNLISEPVEFPLYRLPLICKEFRKILDFFVHVYNFTRLEHGQDTGVFLYVLKI